ncbi:hypothetical protein [Ottowia sp. VDI28]
MTQHPKRLFLAGLLAATLGATAMAQTPPPPRLRLVKHPLNLRRASNVLT